MANRRFNQFVSSLEHKLVCLDGYVQLAADGTVVSDNIEGATVTRTGVGAFKIAFDVEGRSGKASVYNFLSADFTVWNAGPARAWFVQGVQASDAAGVHALSQVASISFKLCNASGVAVDADQVAGISVSIFLSNSSV